MKTKKGKALVVLGVVWLLAFAGLINTWIKERGSEADIVTAFASGNYINTNGTISVYANYGSKYLSDEDKRQLLGDIASSIGIEGELDINTARQDNQDDSGATAVTSYTNITRNASTDIRIVTIENQKMENMVTLEQYILMEVSIDNSVESAVYYEKMIRDAFENMEISADITLSLKGCVKGTLSNSRKNQICESIIKKLNGELVIGSKSEDLYTVYAYTEDIPDYVVNGTTKSNINIAITYDEEQDVSWINVATPILNE